MRGYLVILAAAVGTGFGPAVTMWLSLIRTPAGQKQLFAFTHGRGA